MSDALPEIAHTTVPSMPQTITSFMFCHHLVYPIEIIEPF